MTGFRGEKFSFARLLVQSIKHLFHSKKIKKIIGTLLNTVLPPLRKTLNISH